MKNVIIYFNVLFIKCLTIKIANPLHNDQYIQINRIGSIYFIFPYFSFDLLELGLIPEVDVIAAQIEVDKNNQDLLNSQIALEQSIFDLKSLLDLDEPIRAVGFFDSKLFKISYSQAIFLSFQNNKELAKIKARIDKQQMTVDIAKNNMWPQMDLFASYNRTMWDDTLADAKDIKSDEYQFGLILAYPLYHTGIKEKYRQTKHELKTLNIELEQIETRLRNTVGLLIHQLELSEKRIDMIRNQKQEITKRLNLILEAFAQGLINIDRTHDASDDMLQIDKLYLSAVLERNQKWSELLALMGNYSETADYFKGSDNHRQLP